MYGINVDYNNVEIINYLGKIDKMILFIRQLDSTLWFRMNSSAIIFIR